LKDLLSLRQSSRMWRQLTSDPRAWQSVRLRGLTIVHWEQFGDQVLQKRAVKEVDFSGIRIPARLDAPNITRIQRITDFWEKFSRLGPYLAGLEKIRFGTIPLVLLKEMI